MAEPLTVRAACRRRTPLDGADAQALEHALTITERERDAARAENLRLVAASSIVADQAFRDGGDAARAEVRQLRKLLRIARDAIQDEVSAAGGDDHPVLRAHARLITRIDAVLKGGDGG